MIDIYLSCAPFFICWQLCYERCGTTGAPVMGLQFGYECWCGFQPEAVFTNNGIGTCDSYCAGDSLMTCGRSANPIPEAAVGFWRHSFKIYDIDRRL